MGSGSSRSKGGGGYGTIIGQHHHVKGYQGYAVQTLDSECCPPVVDLISLGTLLAGIAAATLILNQLAIDNIGRKKRSVGEIFNNFLTGLIHYLSFLIGT